MKTKAPAQSKENRRMKRARLIRDGMSWRRACLESGYSLSVANRGPRGYTEKSPGVVRDFERAAEEASYRPEFVKKAITHRMMTSIINGQPSNVTREAKVLGDMKDFDLFVRPTDAPQSIFASLMEPLPDLHGEWYDDETCSWCGEVFEGGGSEESSGRAQLQKHTLVCPKRPITVKPASPQLEAPGKEPQ